jgi:hypothetical protein
MHTMVAEPGAAAMMSLKKVGLTLLTALDIRD